MASDLDLEEMSVSEDEDQVEGKGSSSTRHTLAQITHLKSMYEMGMKSCSKQHTARKTTTGSTPGNHLV